MKTQIHVLFLFLLFSLQFISLNCCKYYNNKYNIWLKEEKLILHGFFPPTSSSSSSSFLSHPHQDHHHHHFIDIFTKNSIFFSYYSISYSVGSVCLSIGVMWFLRREKNTVQLTFCSLFHEFISSEKGWFDNFFSFKNRFYFLLSTSFSPAIPLLLSVVVPLRYRSSYHIQIQWLNLNAGMSFHNDTNQRVIVAGNCFLKEFTKGYYCRIEIGGVYVVHYC